MYRKAFSISSALVIATVCVTIFTMPRLSLQAKDNTRPLLKQLPRFTAANVPAVGPEELPVQPLVAKHPARTGLPEKGASQRPMLRRRRL